MSVERRKIVGVMGSGSSPHEDVSRPVGMVIARLGCHLLTGGGGGVMAAVGQAFVGVEQRKGMALGILKARKARVDEDTGKRIFAPSPPNPWVEIPVVTHLPLSGKRGGDPLSRNHINVLSADVVVALPGGAGTRSEIALAVDYGRPLILYLGAQTVDGESAEDLVAAVGERAVAVRSPGEFEDRLRAFLGDVVTR